MSTTNSGYLYAAPMPEITAYAVPFDRPCIEPAQPAQPWLPVYVPVPTPEAKPVQLTAGQPDTASTLLERLKLRRAYVAKMLEDRSALEEELETLDKMIAATGGQP